MVIRSYTPFEYPVFEGLAKSRNFPIIPQEFLPETGFIVDNHCIGFLYKTDSKIAWLEWIVSNPSSSGPERNEALDMLIDRLLEEAKRLGFKAVFSAVSNSGLIERYQNKGFQQTDTNMTHLVKGL